MWSVQQPALHFSTFSNINMKPKIYYFEIEDRLRRPAQTVRRLGDRRSSRPGERWFSMSGDRRSAVLKQIKNMLDMTRLMSLREWLWEGGGWVGKRDS